MSRAFDPAASPSSHSEPTGRLVAVIRAACSTAQVDPTDARVIHDYANTVVLLPAVGAVARIAAGNRIAAARRSLAITRWLVDHDFPTVAPLPGSDALVIDDHTVTFWTYHRQPEEPQPTTAHLGRVLQRLHTLPEPPIRLPAWQPLESLEDRVAQAPASSALPDTDRAWLLDRIHTIRAELTDIRWPLGHGLVHGDAWAGNLLWNTTPSPNAPRTPHPYRSGDNPRTDPSANIGATEPVLLGDWDSVSRGPREIDLIPSWHAALRYRDDPRWAQDFAQAYGHDLSTHPAFELLLEMRDMVQIAGPLRHAHRDAVYARALRQRIDGTRARDRARWREF